MTASAGDNSILSDQIAYYRARAGEYDEWFARNGRYDRGEEHRRRWLAEISVLEHALASAAPGGRCLELACGTGLWTRALAKLFDHVTAVDASPEVMGINRERLAADGKANVDFVQADLFEWRPAEKYDFAFFSFWLSHVPEERFEPFWAMLLEALNPGCNAFLIDSLYQPESTAADHAPPERGGIVERRLNDGRSFKIVKLFHEPEALSARLAALGWRSKLRSSGDFFLYGLARPDPRADFDGGGCKPCMAGA